jgi:hypothetical protein
MLLVVIEVISKLSSKCASFEITSIVSQIFRNMISKPFYSTEYTEYTEGTVFNPAYSVFSVSSVD